VSDVGITKWRF